MFSACHSTMVAITPKQRLMGTSARNQAVTNFKNTIWGFTPFLGRKFFDPIVQEEMKRVPYQVVERPGGEVGIKVSVLFGGRMSSMFILYQTPDSTPCEGRGVLWQLNINFFLAVLNSAVLLSH